MTELSSMHEETLQPLVKVEEHKIALLFTNYLNSIGIEAKVVSDTDSGINNSVNNPINNDNNNSESKKSFVIYCASARFEQAKSEFSDFIQHPYSTKYQQAAWQNGETVDISDSGSTLYDNFKDNFLAHAGIITLSVFSLCWVIFLASMIGWAQPIFTAIQFYPELSLDAFLADPLRIIGPAFFHFSWLHIVFNTMWWWQLGGSVEKSLGKGALINLLLISAIVSNFGQYLVSGANFGGLSGVVYALVGFVWWYGYLAPERGLSLSKPIVGFLLFWLMLGFADLLPVNVANTAHLLGLLSGCFFAVFTVKVLGKK
jgi:GlpG protein